MKKNFLKLAVVVAILAGMVGVAWWNFEKEKLVQTENFKEYINIYTQSDFSWIAVMEIDSLFRIRGGKDYEMLKEQQYNEWMMQGNFNTPPSKATQREVLKSLGGNIKAKSDRSFCISIFRMAVMFRIVDDLQNPVLPSKKQIAEEYLFYH